MDHISIRGARVHNLKNIDVDIPRNSLVVITGLSGSGKSSLAFDTIYAEGQRRYVESLSLYARQFLNVLEKPDVDHIEGLPPAIAIDQKSVMRNPRSTVGTMTDILDYWRLIFARAGTPHCPTCSLALQKKNIHQILDELLEYKKDSCIVLLAPIQQEKHNNIPQLLEELENAGHEIVRIDGVLYSVSQAQKMSLLKRTAHILQVVVGQYDIPFTDSTSTAQRKWLRDCMNKCLDVGDGTCIAYEVSTGKESIYSQWHQCARCGYILHILEPRCFSFNSPLGACSSCTGLGVRMEIDTELLCPNKKLSLLQGAIQPWFKVFSNQKSVYEALVLASKKYHFSLDVPFEKLNQKHRAIIFHGDGEVFTGVVPFLEEKFKNGSSEYIKREIGKYIQESICRTCNGQRLKKEYLWVTFAGLSLAEVSNMDIAALQRFIISCLKGSNEKKQERCSMLTPNEYVVSRQALEAIQTRLANIQEVGLSYLSLDRSAATLSGGEAQRLRLATQLSSQLVGVVYILDEPSVGLHPSDNGLLIQTLQRLRNHGNSVIVVEHDKDMMMNADQIIDMGPDAGEYGGTIVAQGSPQEIQKNKRSLTGKYLSGAFAIMPPKATRKGNGKKLIVKGASAYNLKNITVEFPLACFIAISGVSGSGKSTLMVDILSRVLAQHFYRSKEVPKEHSAVLGLEHLDKVITIDQSPIGRTPRSNPATYTGLLNYVRDLFTQLPEAKLKGLKAGNFSFNVKEGQCEACSGDGMVRVDMQFLSDMYSPCQVCFGARYNERSLEIHYNGKNIADILSMSVSEALWFFQERVFPIIYEKLRVLKEVGLGYIKLGQSATTLSGGEAQRIKLATELSRKSTGKTLYILDEPTTGLHFEDIKHLLELLQKLVDKGNTVMVIEHNMDVIKSADWVIDLGPGGGDAGGQVVASGTPRNVAKNRKSKTAGFLRKEFKNT